MEYMTTFVPVAHQIMIGVGCVAFALVAMYLEVKITLKK